MSRLRQLLNKLSRNNASRLVTLEQAIKVTRKGIKKTEREDWLFLPTKREKLTPTTKTGFGRVEVDEEEVREIIPKVFAQDGLHSTIDIETFKDCVDWGDKLSGGTDTGAVIIVLDYYLRFDSVPEALDAPEPLSNKDYKKAQEIKLYELLGDEDIERPCRQEGCGRGSVDVSVFCATHHLKSIQKSYNSH